MCATWLSKQPAFEIECCHLLNWLNKQVGYWRSATMIGCWLARIFGRIKSNLLFLIAVLVLEVTGSKRGIHSRWLISRHHEHTNMHPCCG
jgi:hypothetical protein